MVSAALARKRLGAGAALRSCGPGCCRARRVGDDISTGPFAIAGCEAPRRHRRHRGWLARRGDRTCASSARDRWTHRCARLLRCFGASCPHPVTIYAAGPLTNVALAVSLDSQFAELAQELVVMGGSLNPQTEAAEWSSNPRHEFNFWFDPEAASIVLKARGRKISVTAIEPSLK